MFNTRRIKWMYENFGEGGRKRGCRLKIALKIVTLCCALALKGRKKYLSL